MSTTALEVPCPAGCTPSVTYPFVGELAGHLQGYPHDMDRGPAVQLAKDRFTQAAVHSAVQPVPADVPVPGVTCNEIPEEPAMKTRECCGSKGPRHKSGCKAGAKLEAVTIKRIENITLPRDRVPVATNGRRPKPAKNRKASDPVTAALAARLVDERAKRAVIDGRITALEQARELLRAR